MQKAVFVDRDGVINIDYGHVHKKENFHFFDGIFEVLKWFEDNGYLIIVVTNQAGIAKGLYTEQEFLSLTDWMIEKFREKGITINKVYYCPHHPDYTGDCECRKPKPGMILRAKEEFGIDLGLSVLIGDKESDVEAGLRAGVGKIFLFTHMDNNEKLEINNKNVFLVEKLIDIIIFLDIEE